MVLRWNYGSLEAGERIYQLYRPARSKTTKKEKKGILIKLQSVFLSIWPKCVEFMSHFVKCQKWQWLTQSVIKGSWKSQPHTLGHSTTQHTFWPCPMSKKPYIYISISTGCVAPDSWKFGWKIFFHQSCCIFQRTCISIWFLNKSVTFSVFMIYLFTNLTCTSCTNIFAWVENFILPKYPCADNMIECNLSFQIC